MKIHSNNFKEQIKLNGKEIDSILTVGEEVLGNEDLNTVTPSFQTSLLKSVMKQLDIDSNVEIPLNSILNYQFGVKVNGKYEYIDFGDYVVYKVEKQEDLRSYKILCYDKMLYTMKPYTTLQNGTFPMTVRDYIKNLCLDCGLVFKNANDVFANYDKTIESDIYADLGYTYRDIFDELAQVTASNICLDVNNQVEVRYITETNDVIDEEYLKDTNVNFGEKFGKVNSIVLSRSAESDNVYLRDEESVATNGLCEIKIVENQIMNFDNRSDFLPDILEKLNGLEFFLNDFVSTGVCYYDVCDKYGVQIGDNVYPCVMLNDEALVTRGLQENIFTERPKQNTTDYTKADKTDRKINQTYILVDKQNKKIELMVQKDDIINSINLSGEGILIEASKFSLKGKVIDLTGDSIIIESNNFNVDEEGNIKCTGGEIGGFKLGAEQFGSKIYGLSDFTEDDFNKINQYILDATANPLTEEELALYDLNKDGLVNIADLLKMRELTYANITTTEPGTFEINTKEPYKTMLFKDKDGNEVINVSFKGIEVKGASIDEKQEIFIPDLPTGSSYECYYFPLTRMVWCSIYLTGEKLTASSRTVICTIPEGYRPSHRIALATDGLQDYSGILKANITVNGEISIVSSVAKDTGDDMYISGWWSV